MAISEMEVCHAIRTRQLRQLAVHGTKAPEEVPRGARALTGPPSPPRLASGPGGDRQATIGHEPHDCDRPVHDIGNHRRDEG